MNLMAALCMGSFLFLAAGCLTGSTARLRLRSRRARPLVSSRQLWLDQAGVGVTTRQFWAGSMGAGAVAFVTVWLLTGTPLVALVPALGVAGLPGAYFARRRRAHLRRVQAAWPDGLRDVIASIASGHSLPQALNALAASGPPPIQDAFSRFPELARMLGTVPALEVVKEELADPTSDRVIEVLIIAQLRGGQIVREILDDLVVATTRDLKVDDEIETEGLEMQINARAVLVLPWLVLVALTLRPGPFREFYASAAGLLVVVIAGVMSVVGGVLIARLSRAAMERRVFGASAIVPFRDTA